MNRDDLERSVAAHPFLLGLGEHHIRLVTRRLQSARARMLNGYAAR